MIYSIVLQPKLCCISARNYVESSLHDLHCIHKPATVYVIVYDVMLHITNVRAESKLTSVASLKHAVWELCPSLIYCLFDFTVLPEVDDFCCLVEKNDLVPAAKQSRIRKQQA